jgi:N-acetylglucosamine kinase-like BadF-type ATPase
MRRLCHRRHGPRAYGLALGKASGTLPPVLSVFVGLDCGGSSSRVLAVDSSGEIVFQGQSGAANLASTPENRLRRNLSHATEGCPSADFVCGCFAGLVSDDLRMRGEDYLKQLFPRSRVRAEPDYTAALYAAPEGTDICVIAGTGSLVCSRCDGEVVKSGGRGFILGDYGSGYQFGRDGLLHYLDNPTRSSPALREAIMEVFGSMQEGVIVSHVYKSPTPAMTIGKISKAVAQDAKAGEAYALASVDTNTMKLANIVAGHAQQYHSEQKEIGISLTGGVWKSASVFREQFELHLRKLLPGQAVHVQRVTRPPLYGAVELAKEMSYRN